VSVKDPVNLGMFVVASLALLVTILGSVAAMASKVASLETDKSAIKEDLNRRVTRIEQTLERLEDRLFVELTEIRKEIKHGK
jgi:hypothetical protein